MVQARGDLALADEPRAELLAVAQRPTDHLDGDRPVQPELRSEVDDTHAAAPEHGLQPDTTENRTDVGLCHQPRLAPQGVAENAQNCGKAVVRAG